MKPTQLKSRILLIITFILLLFVVVALMILFFDPSKLQGVLPVEFLFGGLKLIIIVTAYGLAAPWIILGITKHVSNKYIPKRLIIELAVILLIALVISTVIQIILPISTMVREGSTTSPFLRSSLFCFVVGSVIFAIYEAWINLATSNELRGSMVKLEKERLALKLNALQHKMDPHFMFNSLNALSELVYQDSKTADKFINQFSKVYRYVLDLNEEPLVSLSREMEVLRSYFYLQKIRMGDALKVNESINERLMSFRLPPLSLQLLVENAIKHNSATLHNPLHISIYNEGNDIVVSNNINKRLSSSLPSGFGLEKLKRTYELMGETEPIISVYEDIFTVKIALINE